MDGTVARQPQSQRFFISVFRCFCVEGCGIGLSLAIFAVWESIWMLGSHSHLTEPDALVDNRLSP